MRQQISRLLILVALFGLLIFASASKSNAVAPESINLCCQICQAQFWDCMGSGRGEASCCAAYTDCQWYCNPATICLPPEEYCRGELATVTPKTSLPK